jgi:hypothetical protein
MFRMFAVTAAVSGARGARGSVNRGVVKFVNFVSFEADTPGSTFVLACPPDRLRANVPNVRGDDESFREDAKSIHAWVLAGATRLRLHLRA